METNSIYRMYDVHMHIIPAVDDGSWSIEMSYSMLYMAYRQGIKKIIATPHSEAFDNWSELVQPAFQELQQMAKEKLPEIELYQGCEIYCREERMNDILRKLDTGIYPSMNGTKYVLVEFAFRTTTKEILFCVSELQKAGWIPIIAHAERYKYLCADESCLNELKEKGCFIQINIDSVYDEYDERIKQNALKLLEQKKADFLGTDAHRMNNRPPNAGNGLKFLYSQFDIEYIDDIVFKNAEKLLKL